VLRAIATLALLIPVAGSGGCSAGHPARAGAASSAIPADSCAATVAPQPAPSLGLCLGGALSGVLRGVDTETTSCTDSPPSGFDGTFVALLGHVETRWEILSPRATGTFDLDAPTSDVTLTVVQAARERTWSSIAETGRSGSITLEPDQSGVRAPAHRWWARRR
jgi:hypothetical protein